jgi:hypothetical protein
MPRGKKVDRLLCVTNSISSEKETAEKPEREAGFEFMMEGDRRGHLIKFSCGCERCSA